MYTDVNKLISYEQGELPTEEAIELFQELLDCGLVWKLQGHYGRTAKILINNGTIKENKDVQI